MRPKRPKVFSESEQGEVAQRGDYCPAAEKKSEEERKPRENGGPEGRQAGFYGGGRPETEQRAETAA
jgi:hypothetical protein